MRGFLLLTNNDCSLHLYLKRRIIRSYQYHRRKIEQESPIAIICLGTAFNFD